MEKREPVRGSADKRISIERESTLSNAQQRTGKDMMKIKAAKDKRLAKYWNTILLWSGYEQYLEVRDIAKILKIESRTVSRRLQWFKKHYPDQYVKIKADRAAIKRSSIKLDRQLEEMNEGRFLSYNSDMDYLIKEKF